MPAACRERSPIPITHHPYTTAARLPHFAFDAQERTQQRNATQPRQHKQ